ncbi:MAG: hypothetical protein LBT40_05930 [Deltaproteobacteria bacterium]|nr:hypothetical protein [Deltaproteobacteria bacterium]
MSRGREKSNGDAVRLPCLRPATVRCSRSPAERQYWRALEPVTPVC